MALLLEFAMQGGMESDRDKSEANGGRGGAGRGMKGEKASGRMQN